MPTLRELLKPTPAQELAYAWELARLDTGASLDLQQAAELLAARIVEHLCTAEAAALWHARKAGGAPLDSKQVKYLLAFLEPHFGSPGVPLDEHDHRALGSASEFLWYELTRTRPEQGRTIECVYGPGFSPTDNGGDGLVVYQLDSGGYCFRLWEIKKHTAKSGSPATKVAEATGQLDRRGYKYLARYTKVFEQTTDLDPALKDFLLSLVGLWEGQDASSGAGVAVAASFTGTEKDHFGNLAKRFPHMADGSRLEGLLNAIGDYPAFVEQVRDELWKGL